MVILGSNKSINSALAEIVFEGFDEVPVQINPDVNLCQEEVATIESSKVIIIDLASIHRDSRLFVRQIHELSPNTHIIALNIYRESEFIKPLIDAGASDYLLVNAEKTEILNAMRKLLHQY